MAARQVGIAARHGRQAGTAGTAGRQNRQGERCTVTTYSVAVRAQFSLSKGCNPAAQALSVEHFTTPPL